MILIVSHLADEHATEVLIHLNQRQADVLLFDTSRYPREIKLHISHATGAKSTFAATVNGKRHDLTKVGIIWWRRPQPFGLDNVLQNAEDRNFAFGECHAAIMGLWSSLDAHWVNEPEQDDVAARKVYQLKVAAELGLTVPRTLVTNDPLSATEFIDKEGAKGTIYKAFSATEQAWRETRLLKPEERLQLEAVRLAPVIFQEYIRADIDLRITIIDTKIFAAEIISGEGGYQIDYRMTMQVAVIREHDLPEEISAKLLSLMGKLGLVYGAIDMRLTPEGDYVFLEVNPSGQWLFIEERTNQPITAAFTDYLIATDKI